MTPLDQAIQLGNRNIIDLFLSVGAKRKSSMRNVSVRNSKQLKSHSHSNSLSLPPSIPDLSSTSSSSASSSASNLLSNSQPLAQDLAGINDNIYNTSEKPLSSRHSHDLSSHPFVINNIQNNPNINPPNNNINLGGSIRRKKNDELRNLSAISFDKLVTKHKHPSSLHSNIINNKNNNNTSEQPIGENEKNNGEGSDQKKMTSRKFREINSKLPNDFQLTFKKES